MAGIPLSPVPLQRFWGVYYALLFGIDNIDLNYNEIIVHYIVELPYVDWITIFPIHFSML